MESVLVLGFLLGIKHAVEADHVAAIASLATRSVSASATMQLGVIWGLGHTLTLFLFGSLVLMLDSIIPELLAQGLEVAVGFMLLFLGGDVIRRVIREKIHFHKHCHEQTTHFHAHSHAGGDHSCDPHHHRHDKRGPIRALLVGMMHGMAGSAALILLVLQTVDSLWTGLFYIAIFGCGSILGMGLMAGVISLPMGYSGRSLTWLHSSLTTVVGLVTIIVGGFMVYDQGFQGEFPLF